MHRGPVWYMTHFCTGIVSKLFTKGPILGMAVPTSVGVMEANIQEKGAEKYTSYPIIETSPMYEFISSKKYKTII